MTTEAVLDVEGMHCASCVSRVEGALRALPQVARAEVSLPLHTARVELSDDGALSELVAAVAAVGFKASPRGGGEAADPLAEEAAAARRRLAQVDVARRRLVLAALAEAPLLVLSVAAMAGAALPGWTAWVQLALAAAVMLAGASIYAVAGRLALHLQANMDTLVALGTGVAFGASLHGLATGGHLHFGPVGMIVTLVLLGRFLEARAQGQTGAALRALLDLTPPTARRVAGEGEGGETVEIPLAEVAPGDLLRVLPGETIPVDGVVAAGQASVSEAMLTGESEPVARGGGDEVTGGTLALDGALTVRVTRVGGDTRLARIVALVAAAQGSKAGVERLADRVSAVFVPVIGLLALLTALGWGLLQPEVGAEGALLAAVAVLVVACPCALGLATPTAIVVAVGRAARSGVLIREASALERLRDVTHVVFDKTGTLTEGRFAVTDVLPLEGASDGPLLCWAAALEAHSEHPLARGVVAEREARGLPALAATDVETAIGGGVSGKVVGAAVAVGSPAWLSAQGVDVAGLPAVDDRATVVGVAREGRLVGALALADALRPTARAAIDALRTLGVTPVLLSGDRQAVAAAVAAELGIEDARAEVTPEGKLEAIEALSAGGGVVAMVGDGLNDAPALAAADVGIALGGGTDVAREAAAVTLLRDDPRAVAEALLLARQTLRTVRQNLGWAFGYNLVTVPLAMLKLLHPVVAAGAMAGSSVLVVANSLRLRRVSTPTQGGTT